MTSGPTAPSGDATPDVAGPAAVGPAAVGPAAAVPGDRVLVRAAAAGDAEAFGVLAERHTPAMLRFARRIVVDPADAEDAVQDALLAAWRGLDGFRGESSLRTWLFTLTSRRAADLTRRAARRPAVVLGPEDLSRVAGTGGPATEPEVRAVGTDLLVALDLALRDLPVGARAVWLLREVEQLSYVEIARILGTSVTVVRGRLARARPALAERMEPWR